MKKGRSCNHRHQSECPFSAVWCSCHRIEWLLLCAAAIYRTYQTAKKLARGFKADTVHDLMRNSDGRTTYLLVLSFDSIYVKLFIHFRCFAHEWISLFSSIQYRRNDDAASSMCTRRTTSTWDWVLTSKCCSRRPETWHVRVSTCLRPKLVFYLGERLPGRRKDRMRIWWKKERPGVAFRVHLTLDERS